MHKPGEERNSHAQYSNYPSGVSSAFVQMCSCGAVEYPSSIERLAGGGAGNSRYRQSPPHPTAQERTGAAPGDIASDAE
jgi:hypothetical protein